MTIAAVEWEAIAGAAGVAVALVLGVVNLAVVRSQRHVDAEYRERQDRNLEALQRQQSEAIGRIADALEVQRKASAPPATGSSTAAAEPAQVGARLERGGTSDRLVIANRGPGRAVINDVQVLGQPDVIVGPTGLPDVDLLPGEEHALIAALSFGNTLPLKVLIRWSDGAGSQHREQTVNYR